VTLSADDLGWEVIGFRRGWQGFLEIDPVDPASLAAHSLPLTRETVRGIDRLGGTILHTSRADPRTQDEGDRTDQVLHVLEALGIDAMVTLGGDGTPRVSAQCAETRGVPSPPSVTMASIPSASSTCSTWSVRSPSSWVRGSAREVCRMVPPTSIPRTVSRVSGRLCAASEAGSTGSISRTPPPAPEPDHLPAEIVGR
jgi:hypothetical protein